MKILQVLPAMEQGGVEWDALELARELARRGVENAIASAGGGMVAKLTEFGVKHHQLPLATKNPFKIIANASRLKRIIKEGGYDLVHVRSRAPAWSVRMACGALGVKFIATYHGVYGTKPAIFKKPYNRVMLSGAKTICVSDYVRRHVETTYAPPDGLLVTIHDGADTERFFSGAVSRQEGAEFLRLLGFDAETPVIVMVGRLTRWKGQHLLLEAVAKMRHRKVGVLFVGSDQGRVEYSAELKRLADALPSGKRAVFIERFENMPLIYAVGSVAVNCSSGQPEAFGRVIPEAQAMGTIVMGTAHGGACETIEDGKTGFLVSPGNVAEMAARLDAILEMSTEERAQMARKAIESVKNRYSVAATCERTLALYRAICTN